MENEPLRLCLLSIDTPDKLLNAAFVIAQAFQYYKLNEEEKRRVMEFVTPKPTNCP